VKELADAKKRKLVDEKKLTVFDMKKSAGFKTTVEKPETELTKDLLGGLPLIFVLTVF